MDLDPEFLSDQEHEHDTSVTSLGISVEGEVDVDKLNRWIDVLLKEKGTDIYRAKGILAVQHMKSKFVFHAVHMLFGGTMGADWAQGEKRISKMVFIGKNLDKAELQASFIKCLVSQQGEVMTQ